MTTVTTAYARAEQAALDPLNTTRQAAAYLTVSIPTMNRWRLNGTGPEYVRFGTAVRYTRESLEAFVRDSAVGAG